MINGPAHPGAPDSIVPPAQTPLAAAPVPLALCDGSGRIIWLNRTWQDLTGARQPETLAPGGVLADWLAEGDRSALAHRLAEVTAQPGLRQCLPGVHLPWSAPERRYDLWLAAEPGAAGAVATSVVCALIETPTATALQAYRSDLDAAKLRFLKTASHDLRQPLNALNLFLGVLQASKSLEQVRAVAGQMQATVDSINETFATMLELARLEMGTVAPTPTAVELRSLSQEVLEAFEDSAAGKGIALRLAGRPLRVETDPTYLARMLRCLVTNAVRVTERGGVLVAVRTRSTGPRLDVYDTGPGFSEAEQALIFEPFYRIDPTALGGADRYGLGLSVLRSTARALGLGIEAGARPGRGARFSILFPARSPA